MVTQLQQRVPMNLGRPYCMDKLNQAYEWIEQQGAFTWDVRLAVVQMAAGVYHINLLGNSLFGPTVPEAPEVVALADVDVGKPISVFQSPLGGFRVQIPFVAADKFGLYQIFNTTPIPGVFAAWTILYDTTVSAYQIRFAPSSAVTTAVTNFALMFHKVGAGKFGDSSTVFFPTPDQFNSLLVDLAEAEIKRNYGLMGAEVAQQKSQASIMMLADQYRSTKMFQPGLQEEGKDAQEEQLSRV
jgi:hypothetical protein